jgi:hypothetical protein
MNIQEEKERNLTTIKNNFKQLQVLCTKIFKTSPQSSEVLMAREVAKYVSCIGLGINPLMIDVNTDTVINEFFQQTKLLTDFTKIKTSSIYSFCTGNSQTLKACFYVYFIKRIESMKSYETLFYYAIDGEPVKTKKKSKIGGFFSRLLKSDFAQQVKDTATDKAIEKGTKAIEDFGTWLANETGIGQGEGNAATSGGKTYFIWKFFPSGPLAYLDKPIKEDISKNYLNGTWKPLIEKGGRGLSYDEIQYYFERLFPKIKAGYYKNQDEMIIDMVKLKATEQNAALNKIVSKDNAKSFLSILFGK